MPDRRSPEHIENPDEVDDPYGWSKKSKTYRKASRRLRDLWQEHHVPIIEYGMGERTIVNRWGLATHSARVLARIRREVTGRPTYRDPYRAHLQIEAPSKPPTNIQQPMPPGPPPVEGQDIREDVFYQKVPIEDVPPDAGAEDRVSMRDPGHSAKSRRQTEETTERARIENPRDAADAQREAQSVNVELDEDDPWHLKVDIRGKRRIRSLDTLLEETGVDLEQWKVEAYKVNSWEMGMKVPIFDTFVDMKGVERRGPVVAYKSAVTPLFQVKARLVRDMFGGFRPAIAHAAQLRKFAPPAGPVETTVFIPDSQHGFRWSVDMQRLIPTHDRVAFDAVVQYCRLLQPKNIVLLGDMLDFSGKYQKGPEWHQTWQPAIDECHWQIGELRKACPNARIWYLAGNHEKRPEDILNEHAQQLARARDPVTRERLMTADKWLRLDAWDVEYVGPYGAVLWMWDGSLKVHHGKVVRGGGGNTTSSVVSKAVYHEVFGHIHRREDASKTVDSPSGPVHMTALTPGCLCNLDPKYGPPAYSAGQQDWQHGVGVGRYCTETGVGALSNLAIVGGRLFCEYGVLSGVDRKEEIAAATGYAQIAG